MTSYPSNKGSLYILFTVFLLAFSHGNSTAMPDDLVPKLRSSGYSRIQISEGPKDGYYVGACRNSERVIMFVDQQGAVKASKNQGQCRRSDGFEDQKFALLDDGYNRVRLIEEKNRKYLVEACRGNEKYRLGITRESAIENSEKTGECSPPVKPEQLETLLEKKGFSNIQITDRRLPGYQAQVCHRTSKIDLKIDEFGEVYDSSVIGECK